MEPTWQEVIAPIESAAPLAWQEEWDNAGWQVAPGDPQRTACSGALLSLDVTEAVVDEAVREGINLIVSHHPLLFRGVKRLTGATAAERIVAAALRHGVAIYAAHTNMDAAPDGVNFRLARMLGLERTTVLVPGSCAGVGLGCVGELPEAVPTAEFLQRIVRVLGLSCLRHSPVATGTVRRIALCGGSGSEFIPAAVAAGAQLYLTADLKYHDFQHGEDRITLVDGGHFETERQVLDVFCELISKKIPNFAVRPAAVPSNAVSCFVG